MPGDIHVGVDLGGTQVRAGLVEQDNIHRMVSLPTNGRGTSDDVLQQLFSVIDQVITNETRSIGIGVPGLVDIQDGVVYDLVFIPSWKDIPLGQIIRERYGLPVCINNDANCFALGEWKAGKGRGRDNLAGLTIGTGMGTGIVINNKLYSGKHCGAGEFGMIDYLGHNLEYYTSGQFFEHVYLVNGKIVFERAMNGDLAAIDMYKQFGTHLGNAIKFVLYALDVELIVLGGSVSAAWQWFNEPMWQSVKGFAYKKYLEDLSIEVSELENGGIIGAAALYNDSIK